jgi:hydrogenase nickel incorporation protein HypB
MFQKADLVLLTKVDLIPHLDFDIAAVEDGLARVMPEANMLRVSAKTGEGIGAWLQWLDERRPAPVENAPEAHHHHHHGDSHGHHHEHH